MVYLIPNHGRLLVFFQTPQLTSTMNPNSPKFQLQNPLLEFYEQSYKKNQFIFTQKYMKEGKKIPCSKEDLSLERHWQVHPCKKTSLVLVTMAALTTPTAMVVRLYNGDQSLSFRAPTSAGRRLNSLDRVQRLLISLYFNRIK